MTKSKKFEYGERLEAVAAVRRWTIGAVQCYLRGCVCSGCFYEKFFEKTREEYSYLKRDYNCKMKASVLELVRTFGVPYESEQIKARCNPQNGGKEH